MENINYLWDQAGETSQVTADQKELFAEQIRSDFDNISE